MGQSRNNKTKTEEVTKRAVSTRARRGSKVNVSKGRKSTEEDGTCGTATTTELTTVGKGCIGDNMQGSK